MALKDIRSWQDTLPAWRNNATLTEAHMLQEIQALRVYAEQLEALLRQISIVPKNHWGIQDVRNMVAAVLPKESQ